MKPPPIDSAVLDEYAAGYRATQILLSANRVGVFSAIGRGELTARECAGALQADLRGTRILCDALAALGLLEKTGERYRNSAVALQHLIPDAPQSKVDLLLHNARLYESWGKLGDAVRTGRPVDEEAIDPRLRFEARAFARAMADTGRESSRLTATAIDLSEVRHFLDLGGGPGSYAIEFAQRAPDLEAVIFDSAETLEVARQNVAAARLSGRIEVRAGNAFEDELGSGYDLILLSNFIHIYSPEQNRPLMGRCAAALAAGGRLAIKDFFLDPDRTSPTAAALFAVNMLVNTEAGDCYTLSEVRTWCAAAGLRFETYRELTAQSGLVIVKKPS